MAPAQVFLRGEQQIDHQLDDLARCEVLSGFLVRLFRADPDEFLKNVSHLDIVDALRGKIDFRECLHNFVEQVLLRHPGNLLVKGKPIHDIANVLGESADVAVEIGRELVRIVQQRRHVELRKIIKRSTSEFLKQAPNYVLGSCLYLRMLR